MFVLYQGKKTSTTSTTNQMSHSNGWRWGFESNRYTVRKKSRLESGERANVASLFLGGEMGRGGVRSREAGGREGVVERDAVA